MSTDLPIQTTAEVPAAAQLQGSTDEADWNEAVMNNYLRTRGIVSYDSRGLAVPGAGPSIGLGGGRGSRGRSALKPLTGMLSFGLREARQFMSHSYATVQKA